MDTTDALLPSEASPPLRGIKKILSSRSRNSVVDSETSSLRGGLRSSADSAAEVSPSRESSHDGSSKSGSSGMRKLIPGHIKRKKRRMIMRDAEPAQAGNELSRDGNLDNTTASVADRNHSSTSLVHDGDSSLLTDDSEPETAPPLISHKSHAGYLTTSSPLITTTTIHEAPSQKNSATETIPQSDGGSRDLAQERADVSPLTVPTLGGTDPTLDVPFTGLVDKADTLGPPLNDRPSRRQSVNRSLRNISPGRRLKDALSPLRPIRSPRGSPERKSIQRLAPGEGDQSGKGTSIGERRQAKNHDNPPTLPTNVDIDATNNERIRNVNATLPVLNTQEPPRTPPSASITPLTTVTPPTPVEAQSNTPRWSPRRASESQDSTPDSPNTIKISPSGNMISHRRARSIGTNQPSKLSNSVLAPLTPTIEEAGTPSVKGAESRNITSGSGFFSSWVSAAQNAANTITTTLNTQNRNRSGTSSSEPEKTQIPEESTLDHSVTEEPDVARKEPAIKTLGTGDLNFGHLGLDINVLADEKLGGSSVRPDLKELRKDSTVRRDEAAAKIEDMLAKRAVSAAYDKNAQTPVAEVPDPMNGITHTQSSNSVLKADQTAPVESIFDGESGSAKRSNSVRSRIQQRRSRRSSSATGQSTIGAMIGASTATLANPANGPRLTGFAVAPKQRNKTFHQLFRSVPDDDYLIEDYSCALQRDIILAGRIYISEGHICFSSNILGWVTTLVISFEEVVSVERETTAMVFPNAIAIQTLHARHTFRSLLSREATYELLISIWKTSHPAAFQKSVNGRQLAEENSEGAEKNAESEIESEAASDEDDVIYDEDAEDDGAGSFADTIEGSLAGSDGADVRSVIRKASGVNGNLTAPAQLYPSSAGDVQAGANVVAVAADGTESFPGPATHAPTECSDSATHYEKVVKDESVPAPLGKIYSMLFGPTSGAFVAKYLLEEQKVTELQIEDDKKGLSNEIRSRSYSYIKPLGGSIGPKQTKCITTENMDAFDLDKAVSVTCTTQTPDVPSGNIFSVKTRYCLSWAPGNATRFQMNCGIEWSGKSWLKSPIEKGAIDGQQQYGNELVKSLKAGLSRPRAATAGSKGAKPGKKRQRTGKSLASVPKTESPKPEIKWGLLEPLRFPLGLLGDIFKPFANAYVAGAVIACLLLLLWLRSPGRRSAGDLGYIAFTGPERIAAYEEMWRKEESVLWEWLEERADMENIGLGAAGGGKVKDDKGGTKKKLRERQKLLGEHDVEARLREERMSDRQMENAIRTTQERLEALKSVVEKRTGRKPGSHTSHQSGATS